MSDSGQTFLRTAISEVLPDLPEMNKDILEESLQSLGVETSDDFQFIEEPDLLSSLRPIQARKLIATWKLRRKLFITVCLPFIKYSWKNIKTRAELLIYF